MSGIARPAARALIRAYQLSFSALLGRECRYLPTCSDYAAEAIDRHGLWAGAWMGTARICRCHPLGGSGFDPPPAAAPPDASWARPWRYGAWRTPSGAAPTPKSAARTPKTVA